MARLRRLGRNSVMGIGSMMKMNVESAVAERIGGPESRGAATVMQTHLRAGGCAARYDIAKRTWERMVDAGKAPQPSRFNRLCRWSIASLEAWEKSGYRPVRQVGRAK